MWEWLRDWVRAEKAVSRPPAAPLLRLDFFFPILLVSNPNHS